MRRKISKKYIQAIFTVFLVLIVSVGMFYGIKNAGKKLDENGLASTERNLRRGAVACYALEGRYPESLDYLMKNYGVTVDDSKYIVYYTIFASNIMPDISVVPR